MFKACDIMKYDFMLINSTSTVVDAKMKWL